MEESTDLGEEGGVENHDTEEEKEVSEVRYQYNSYL